MDTQLDKIKEALNNFDASQLKIVDLPKEMSEQAEIYAYWSSISALLDYKASLKELELKKLEAAKYLAIRQGKSDSKLTESYLQNLLTQDEELHALRQELAELNYLAKRARGYEAAWRHRFQLLFSRALLEKAEISMRTVKEIY